MKRNKIFILAFIIPVLLIANNLIDSKVSKNTFGNNASRWRLSLSPSYFNTDSRPTLSGPHYMISKPHLIVHYTTAGEDSTTIAYAESVAVLAETCWARVTRLGWYPPAPDPARGGMDPDQRFDITIKGTGNPYNMWDSIYTNPYPDGASCYNIQNTGRSDIDACVIHEFHHACQGRCDNWINPGWFYENTSEHIEDIIFPGCTDLYSSQSTGTYSPLKHPFLNINSMLYAYPGGLWARFLHEYYGPDIVRQIWHLCGMHPGSYTLYDTDSVLRVYYESNLEKALGHYAIWRYFTGSRNDNQHFGCAAVCTAAVLHARHTSFPATGNQGDQGPRGPGGTCYIEFITPVSQSLYISFDGLDDYQWRTYAICIIDANNSIMQPILLNENKQGAITIPAWMARKVVLVPVVTTWYITEGDTTPALQFSYNASLVGEAVGLEDESQVLFILGPISPNPVKDYATINYTLPKGTKGLLTIIDVTGRVVQKFKLRGDGFPAKLIWDRKNRFGKSVNSGIYFCQLTSNGSVIRNKIVLE